MRGGLRSARIPAPVGCFSALPQYPPGRAPEVRREEREEWLGTGCLRAPGPQRSAWQGARAESASDLLNFSVTFGGSE